MKKTTFLFLASLFVVGAAVALFAQDGGGRRPGRSGDGSSSSPDGAPGSGGNFGGRGGPGGGQRGGPGGGGQRGGGPGGGGFGGGPGGGGQRGGFGGGPGGFGGGPGGGGFGGGPGGNWGGPGGAGGANSPDRMIAMLKAMDANGDGRLDPNEIPEYRRPFVTMMITRLGGDPSKTVVIADLERRAATGGSNSTRQTGNNASTIALPTDPLVPYFGEKETPLPVTVAFGQREPQAKTVTYNSASSLPANQSDQILRSAREIMSRYDKNQNGTLDKDKGEWVSSLPFNADAADTNRDGRISMAELVAALGGKSSNTMGSAVVSTKQSTAYDRLPPGVPNWFFERDKNQDGQLTMLEYANGQPWTEQMADEFQFLDTNNDGIATIAEVYAALKKVDDDKRLKDEQARREQQRRTGVTVAATPPPDAGTNAAPASPVASSEGETPSAASSAPDATTATPVVTPAESQPAWRPAAPSSGGGTAIPANAPYSAGSGDSGQRSRSGPGSRGNRNGPPQQYNQGRRGN